jgi:hypothetical protein
MRLVLLVPVFLLAACAAASPKDLEKMSTLDVCYEGMMDGDKRQLVEAELNRRKETCDKYEAQLQKMASEEMRAGGGPSGMDAAKSAGTPTSPQGGMGGGRY